MKFDRENKPGISNLLTIHASCSGESIKALEAKYADKGYGEFKLDTAQAVVDVLKPIQDRYHELLNSEALDDILDAGADKASYDANKMLRKAKKQWDSAA